ncbi:MAG: ABC transporter permease, partial [Spirochaetaceae bacterium]|nr:ABC transporter permease [Spirochaetaceae bacterium]
MRAYVIRRILLVIPTLFIVTVLVFLSVRFIPGDIIDVMTARMTATQSGTIDEEALKRQLGLDKPVYAQYAKWIGDIVLRGTLGRSLYSGSLGSATVEQKLAGRVGVTVELGLLAILTGVIIAVPIGIYSAIRQYTVADYAGRAVAIFGLATPNFWLGLMVMIYPAIWWGWTPPLTHVRFTEDPWANLGMLIIPAVILGTYLAASTMRMTRTMMLEVLRQDYVRTSWAKGLAERTVVLRHAVKNALIPVVTLVALQLPIIAGGSVIIENIFNLPGLGSLMLSALNARDYPVVSGVNLLFASVVVVINLGTDLTYALL